MKLLFRHAHDLKRVPAETRCRRTGRHGRAHSAGACPHAVAANPALDINQYAHTAWTARQGFFDGVVRAITQTQDGYLWLGTELGLVRFDGVRAVPWTFPSNQRLVSSSILSLLATRDGSLWIGTVDGLARWQGGTLTHYAELAGQRIQSLTEDRTGKVWAASFRPAGAMPLRNS